MPDLEWFGAHLDPLTGTIPNGGRSCTQLDGSEEALRSATTSCSSSSMPTTSRDGCAPSVCARRALVRIIDTSLPAGQDFADPGREVLVDPGDHYIANPRSTVVLLGR